MKNDVEEVSVSSVSEDEDMRKNSFEMAPESSDDRCIVERSEVVSDVDSLHVLSDIGSLCEFSEVESIDGLTNSNWEEKRIHEYESDSIKQELSSGSEPLVDDLSDINIIDENCTSDKYTSDDDSLPDLMSGTCVSKQNVEGNRNVCNKAHDQNDVKFIKDMIVGEKLLSKPSGEKISVVDECRNVNSIDPKISKMPDKNCSGLLENKRFLCTEAVILYLSTSTESLPQIPTGVKNDCFYIVNNDHNSTIKISNKNAVFIDDCGNWQSSSGSSPKSHFMWRGNELKRLYYFKGKFGYYSQQKGVRKFKPLDEEPEVASIIVLNRQYSSLKINSKYKRRVSYFTLLSKNSPLFRNFINVAVVEYLGRFPGYSSHGNTSKQSNFIRTPTKVLRNISAMSRTGIAPKFIYNRLILDSKSMFDEPRNRQQIHNIKYIDNKKSNQYSSHNIADQIQSIVSNINENALVQYVIHQKGSTPSIVLFTKKANSGHKKFVLYWAYLPLC